MIVICNGMMRSGSTLQYNLAAEALETQGPISRGGFMGGFTSAEAITPLEAMRDSTERHIIKTHDAPLPAEFYTEGVQVLYCYRDIRDVAASIKKKWDRDFGDILREVEANLAIHDQILAMDGVLHQPYSLLLGDLGAALDQITSHLSASLSAKERTAILERNALDTVQRQLAQRRKSPLRALFSKISGRFRIDQTRLYHDDHVSASGGKDGDWQHVFADAEVTALEDLMRAHAPTTA